MTALACPDCGAELRFRDLFNGTSFCECPNPECRANWIAHGATREKAADKLVAMCEQHGYTRHIEQRLCSLLSGESA